MIYEFTNGILTIYENGNINLAQPYNPITETEFISKDEVLDWLAYHIKTSYNADPITLDVNLENETGDIYRLNDDKAIIVPEGEIFKLSIDVPGAGLDSVLKLVITKENFRKEYSIILKASKAKKTILLDEPGVYFLEYNIAYDANGIKKKSIHEKDQLQVTIG